MYRTHLTNSGNIEFRSETFGTNLFFLFVEFRRQKFSIEDHELD